jgi:hypothetical protein
MTIIAFHTPTLDVRGTCISIYDYAHFNEILLGNKSIIVIPYSSIVEQKNDQIIINKFVQRFEIFFYNDLYELENYIKNCDILYCIKYGKKDEIISKKIKTVVHCVFDMSEPHGDIYAGVSQQLAQKFNSPVYVPHMISLDPTLSHKNLRKSLFIPEEATVFGRIGGLDTWNIPMVNTVIRKVVRLCPHSYFIFINTTVFYNKPNIYFFDKVSNPKEKVEFINTCDAMIHNSLMGESICIAIGEFSVCNKKIITFGGDVLNDNYKKILKNDAIYYHHHDELLEILISFDKSKYIGMDLNCYKKYQPESVMSIFKKVFIDRKQRLI